MEWASGLLIHSKEEFDAIPGKHWDESIFLGHFDCFSVDRDENRILTYGFVFSTKRLLLACKKAHEDQVDLSSSWDSTHGMHKNRNFLGSGGVTSVVYRRECKSMSQLIPHSSLLL